MANNVAPGDMAWVINCELAETAWTISHIVEVGPRCNCEGSRVRGRGRPVWMLATPLVGLFPTGMVLVDCLPDWCLKRIPPKGAAAPMAQQPMEETA